MGRCLHRGPLQCGVSAAAARHPQRDGRPRPNAQRTARVSAATVAAAAKPIGGLSVSERVCAHARYVLTAAPGFLCGPTPGFAVN